MARETRRGARGFVVVAEHRVGGVEQASAAGRGGFSRLGQLEDGRLVIGMLVGGGRRILVRGSASTASWGLIVPSALAGGSAVTSRNGACAGFWPASATAFSSEMIRRMEARISSIDGSC
jgi:hypothetical protein